MPLHSEQIRKDFPILERKIQGNPLIYFDNAASTLKPKSVSSRVARHYEMEACNIHRGLHTLSEEATTTFERVREKTKEFIDAESIQEIIFTKGTTDSINLVAQSFSHQFLNKGDAVIITEMEHHSNIVPWQIQSQKYGFKLKVCPVNDDGSLDVEALSKLLTPEVKLLSLVYISNSLGTINPIKDIIVESHKKNIPVFVDAAQAVGHLPLSVKKIDCDFLAFSSHKTFGPTGLGVLYGKKNWLEQLDPVQGGGDMIENVSFSGTTYNQLPYKFEAGTPHIGGVIGFESSLDYIDQIGVKNIYEHEQFLIQYATKKVESIDELSIVGQASHKGGILSFILEDIHTQDIGMLLDQQGIAIRTGHHCTQPLMKRFQISSTARASFSIYNIPEEVDYFVNSIKKIIKLFS